MATPSTSDLPKPRPWDGFEDIVWDVYTRKWNELDALLPRSAAGGQPTARRIASTVRTSRWPSIPDPQLISEIGSRVANARTTYAENLPRTQVSDGKPQPQRTDLEAQVTGTPDQPVPCIEISFPR
jgi:hypothetical protein